MEAIVEPAAIISSESMHRVMEIARRVAQTNATVLISGETGSGKEIVARTIHGNSLRCSKPWIDVNCGALPENLVESELFGFEKGAFSGADVGKPGLLELANKGVFFLDEVGELDAKLQVKLLRVLDGAPYYRLGGTRKVSVDVRFIAATSRDLKQAASVGEFRSDLYYRLSAIHIEVPPLRKRPECILALAEFLLREFNPRLRFAPEALDLLQRYSWPGNVRELKNVITRVAALGEHAEIRPADLPAEIAACGTQTIPVVEPVPASGRLEEMENEMIRRILDQTHGHQGKAAGLLGISRRTLYRRLRSMSADASFAETPAIDPDFEVLECRTIVPNLHVS